MSEEAAASAGEALSTPEGAGEGSSTPEGSSSTESTWYGEFSTDDQQFLEAKGWTKEGKGPGDVVKAYRNLERLRGVSADKLVKLPDFKNEEEKGEFFTRLGVPDSPEGYETPGDLEVAGQPLDGDVLAKLSHRAKLLPEQHAEISKGVQEWLEEGSAAQMAARQEQIQVDKKALERDWGNETERNYAAASKAANRFGLDAKAIDAIEAGLGYKGTIELFASIGRALGEGKAPEGNTQAQESFGPTPSSAKQQIDSLMADQGFRQKLFDGDTDATAKWERLKKIAFES